MRALAAEIVRLKGSLGGHSEFSFVFAWTSSLLEVSLLKGAIETIPLAKVKPQKSIAMRSTVLNRDLAMQ